MTTNEPNQSHRQIHEDGPNGSSTSTKHALVMAGLPKHGTR
ncbi:MAG TPA: hypothetical protein VMT26_06010 [Candidatus Bathyarchaeia archaeon]|nr:hypothetical protein [Candidatus Bathyarchaeia archaeon]